MFTIVNTYIFNVEDKRNRIDKFSIIITNTTVFAHFSLINSNYIFILTLWQVKLDTTRNKMIKKMPSHKKNNINKIPHYILENCKRTVREL